MSINRVIISGNLTRDPELRRTQSGMAIMSFGVAVNDRRRNQQTGEWEDYANFVDCTMFGNRAESLSNYLSKGTKVAIEGKLRWSQWERDGQKRSKLEVIVDELEFMSSRDRQGGYQQGGYQQQSGYQQGGYQQGGYQAPDNGGYQAAPVQAAAPAPSIDASSSVYDDDIPF
ncbi:MAG: single-stranded DNA-binding protein [Eggerthellaceae bacterium]|nr:single-stranded DNA-binding protein [Eggerthellaceae bacterium]